MKPPLAALAVVALAAADAAATPIYRCATPGGGVSYQELPCARDGDGGRLELPTVFPEVDAEARERLLQREAALDRRLEAARERLSREEMTRMSARAQVAAAQAAAPPATEAVVYYAPAWPQPLWRPHPGAHRFHPRALLR